MAAIDHPETIAKVRKNPVHEAWSDADIVNQELLRQVLDRFVAAGHTIEQFFRAGQQIQVIVYDSIAGPDEQLGFTNPAFSLEYTQWHWMRRMCEWAGVKFPDAVLQDKTRTQEPADLAYCTRYTYRAQCLNDRIEEQTQRNRAEALAAAAFHKDPPSPAAATGNNPASGEGPRPRDDPAQAPKRKRPAETTTEAPPVPMSRVWNFVKKNARGPRKVLYPGLSAQDYGLFDIIFPPKRAWAVCRSAEAVAAYRLQLVDAACVEHHALGNGYNKLVVSMSGTARFGVGNINGVFKAWKLLHHWKHAMEHADSDIPVNKFMDMVEV